MGCNALRQDLRNRMWGRLCQAWASVLFLFLKSCIVLKRPHHTRGFQRKGLTKQNEHEPSAAGDPGSRLDRALQFQVGEPGAKVLFTDLKDCLTGLISSFQLFCCFWVIVCFLIFASFSLLKRLLR